MLLDCDSTWAIFSSHRPGIRCPPWSLRGVFLSCILKNTWKLWSASPEKLYSEVQKTGFINLCLTKVLYITSPLSAAFVAITVVSMKSTVIWDVALWSPIDTTHVSEERAASVFKDEISRGYKSYLYIVFYAAFTLIASILKVDTVLFRNVSELLPDYTASRSWRQYSSRFFVSVTLDGRRHRMARLSLSCLGHEFCELLVLYSCVYADGSYVSRSVASPAPSSCPGIVRCQKYACASFACDRCVFGMLSS
jgi:hypothetical protein